MPSKTLFYISVTLLLLACSKTPQKTATIPVQSTTPMYSVEMKITETEFTPDKSPDASLICLFTNHSDSMLAIDMDTIMNILKVYGQGANQKYPMYILYSLPPNYDSGELLYIDPHKTEVLFRSPLQQLFFGQMRFNSSEEYGWMWKSTVNQKANLSPAHDFDALQPEAKFWFTLRWGGKTYTSNISSIKINPSAK